MQKKAWILNIGEIAAMYFLLTIVFQLTSSLPKGVGIYTSLLYLIDREADSIGHIRQWEEQKNNRCG